MKFSSQSEHFVERLIKKVDLVRYSKTNEEELVYNTCIHSLIDDLIAGDHYASQVISKKLIKTDITKIHAVQQIPKPYGFNSHYLPDKIRKSIEESASYHIQFKFKIQKRNIVLHFITMDEPSSVKMLKYNDYAKMAMIWLYMAGMHASKMCSTTLNIYVYLTDFKKVLPNNNINVIDTMNINSGLSDVCRKSGEIVIYRKEEWFKVLIHETFHNFGLDFAAMDIGILKTKIRKLFPVKSQMLVFECYTELWAEIINCLFCSYTLIDNKTDKDSLFLYFNFILEFERIFSLFQMIKFLNFMGLTYHDILHSSKSDIAHHLYKEKTHVFPYFILKSILMNNVKSFIIWCYNTNINLLRFSQNNKSLLSFYDLIKQNYQSNVLFENIRLIEKFMKTLNKSSEHKLIMTSRMSICELV
jgi:hypothetical protein